MKVYTRNGDGGQTSLMGEKNVAKDDVRIEANGMLDELNAVLGVVKAAMPESPQRIRIDAVQNQIMRIMGVVAGARTDMSALTRITTQLEQDIDAMAAEGKFCFSVPGETPLNAWLHVARARCRTAERRLWTMHARYPVDAAILQFINRLSDYLFVLAVECEMMCR